MVSPLGVGDALRVGMIGCSRIAQAVHIPNINLCWELFRTTYLCDVSPKVLAHCSTRVLGQTPKITTDPEVLCSSAEVDVVLIASADAYHVEHVLLALKHNKWCLVERPLALQFQAIDSIIEAERHSKGKVFVGMMRRYSAMFSDVVEQVGRMDKVTYARVRNITGRDSIFVQQPHISPQVYLDLTDADAEDQKRHKNEIYYQALHTEFGIPFTPDSRAMLRQLRRLGTHDLSAMRELLGMPQRIAGAMLNRHGISTIMFDYGTYTCMYEFGIHCVLECDAQIEVYSDYKIIHVQFGNPNGKGCQTTMTLKRPIGIESVIEENVRKVLDNAYLEELNQFWECVVGGETPKSSAADARNDVELFRMIIQAGVNT